MLVKPFNFTTERKAQHWTNQQSFALNSEFWVLGMHYNLSIIWM